MTVASSVLLAVIMRIATQMQALSAILFLYQSALEVEINWIGGVVPAR